MLCFRTINLTKNENTQKKKLNKLIFCKQVWIIFDFKHFYKK